MQSNTNSNQPFTGFDPTKPTTSKVSDASTSSNNSVASGVASDYKTSIGVAKFISFIGWLMCIIALTMIIMAFFGAGRMGVLAVAPGLGLFIGGLILVIAGQTSRAVMDNTNYSKQMVELMKKSA